MGAQSTRRTSADPAFERRHPGNEGLEGEALRRNSQRKSQGRVLKRSTGDLTDGTTQLEVATPRRHRQRRADDQLAR